MLGTGDRKTLRSADKGAGRRDGVPGGEGEIENDAPQAVKIIVDK